MTLALTVVLAAASIIYELLLAQTLASVLGGTLVRYNVTIGLYLAAMGAGSWWSGPGASAPARRLVKVEVALSALGAIAPAIALAVDAFVGPSGPRWPLEVAGHGLVVLIGLLSGFELPLLMQLGEAESRGKATRVLAVDYFGTLIGAVCFPLILLPGLGLFGVALSTSLANAVAAIALARRTEGARLIIAALLAIAALDVLGLLKLGQLHATLVNQLYLRH
ncbi:MAG: hypothetical protein HYV07_11730 [Deltaproteobacteria bacterium]|nr:hypothetical protein [Deltaproteobacteria bacterium]